MKNKTIEFYNKNAKKWEERVLATDNSYRLKIIKKFKKIIQNGKIIELGCGTGLDAILLTKNGYEYYGIDASKELLKIAKNNFSEGIFSQMDFEKILFQNSYFDGFWASASLLHLPKNKIKKVLVKIKKICKPGSTGFISLKIGEGEEFDKKTGLFFAYYQKGEIQKILEECGFKIIRIETTKDTLNRSNHDWIWIFLNT